MLWLLCCCSHAHTCNRTWDTSSIPPWVLRVHVEFVANFWSWKTHPFKVQPNLFRAVGCPTLPCISTSATLAITTWVQPMLDSISVIILTYEWALKSLTPSRCHQISWSPYIEEGEVKVKFEHTLTITRRYDPLRGPTSGSWGGLRPSAEAFFALWA